MSARRPRRDPNAPAASLPQCPPHLQGEARKEWSRTGKRLLDAGLVTDIDRTALAVYCQAWARWVEAEEQLVKYGTVVKSPNGFPIQSPYLPIANKAMEQMTRLLVEFGMSPSSRSRVTILAPPEPRPRMSVPIEDDDEPDPRLLLRSTP